jgi:hypothetical protein
MHWRPDVEDFSVLEGAKGSRERDISSLIGKDCGRPPQPGDHDVQQDDDTRNRPGETVERRRSGARLRLPLGHVYRHPISGRAIMA